MTARRARWLGLCLVILATAACGLKGEPQPPEPAETSEPGARGASRGGPPAGT